MKRSRFSDEQIIAIVKQQEALAWRQPGSTSPAR
jgi:hypothetical protein